MSSCPGGTASAGSSRNGKKQSDPGSPWELRGLADGPGSVIDTRNDSKPRDLSNRQGAEEMGKAESSLERRWGVGASVRTQPLAVGVWSSGSSHHRAQELESQQHTDGI